MITPPSSSMFTCVTRPPSSLHRPVSSKPNASAIQSAARPTSSYENIGTTRCSAIEAHVNGIEAPADAEASIGRAGGLALAFLLGVGVRVAGLVGVTTRTVIAGSLGAGFGRFAGFRRVVRPALVLDRVGVRRRIVSYRSGCLRRCVVAARRGE